MGEKIGKLTGAGGRSFFEKFEATLIRDVTGIVSVFGLGLLWVKDSLSRRVALQNSIDFLISVSFDAYAWPYDNPLKNHDMLEDEFMNTYIHPVLKKALHRFSGIRYVP